MTTRDVDRLALKSGMLAGKVKPLRQDFFISEAAVSNSSGRRALISVSRIRERLDDIGLDAASASKKAGLERGYIQDFFDGKKVSANGGNLEKLAYALDCSVGYLTGQTNTIGAPTAGGETLPLVGDIEPGAARRKREEGEVVAAQPDARYPHLRHLAFVVRTGAYAHLGIYEGQTLVAVDPDDWRARFGEYSIEKPVVCEIQRRGLPGAEIVIRRPKLRDGAIVLESATRQELEPDRPLFLDQKHRSASVRILGIVASTFNKF